MIGAIAFAEQLEILSERWGWRMSEPYKRWLKETLDASGLDTAEFVSLSRRMAEAEDTPRGKNPSPRWWTAHMSHRPEAPTWLEWVTSSVEVYGRYAERFLAGSPAYVRHAIRLTGGIEAMMTMDPETMRERLGAILTQCEEDARALQRLGVIPSKAVAPKS